MATLFLCNINHGRFSVSSLWAPPAGDGLLRCKKKSNKSIFTSLVLSETQHLLLRWSMLGRNGRTPPYRSVGFDLDLDLDLRPNIDLDLHWP